MKIPHRQNFCLWNIFLPVQRQLLLKERIYFILQQILFFESSSNVEWDYWYQEGISCFQRQKYDILHSVGDSIYLNLSFLYRLFLFVHLGFTLLQNYFTQF